MRDFFEKKLVNLKENQTSGSMGMNLLHVIALTYAAFSSYHGIHVISQYHAGSFGTVFGIVGIVSLELFLAGLYLSFIGRKISTTDQLLAAGASGGIVLVMTLLAIVIDSNLTAGNTLSPWMIGYLQFIIPISPAVAAIGAVLVHALSPEAKFGRKVAYKEVEVREAEYDAKLAEMDADLEVRKSVKNLQLNAKMDVAKKLHEQYQDEALMAAVESKAQEDMVVLLGEVGISAPKVRKPVIDVPYETKNGTAPKLNGIPKN